MKAFWAACPVFAILFIVAAAGQQVERIDDAALARAGQTGDDWLTYGINQAETRFSPLTDINATNVESAGPRVVVRRGRWRRRSGGHAARGQRHDLRHHQLEHRVRRGRADRQGEAGVGIRR